MTFANLRTKRFPQSLRLPLCALAGLALGKVLESCDTARCQLFSWPTAQLASIFFTAPCSPDAAGYPQFHVAALQVAVAAPCSAVDFFGLLCATLFAATLTAPHPVKLNLSKAFTLLAAAYLVAICANAMRVISAVYIRLLCGTHFSERMLSHAHLAVGLCVFSFVLLISHLLTRKYHELATA